MSRLETQGRVPPGVAILPVLGHCLLSGVRVDFSGCSCLLGSLSLQFRFIVGSFHLQNHNIVISFPFPGVANSIPFHSDPFCSIPLLPLHPTPPHFTPTPPQLHPTPPHQPTNPQAGTWEAPFQRTSGLPLLSAADRPRTAPKASQQSYWAAAYRTLANKRRLYLLACIALFKSTFCAS